MTLLAPGAEGFSPVAALADALAMWTYVLRNYEQLRAIYARSQPA